MRRFLLTLLGVLAMIAGVATFLNGRADRPQADAQSGKLQVVTTNSILEDMVNQVGQGRVQVYSIVARGTDPHEYEPRPTDVAAAVEADVLFHNGLHLETGGSGWFTKLVTTAGKRFGQDVFAASAGVQPRHLTANPKEEDPHAWLDLANGIQYVRTIARVLREKDPKNAQFYQQNAAAYTKRLARLHQTAQTQFQDLPKRRRILITSEGAFKYFGAAYGLTPAYIWELNSEAQGTPEQMRAVLTKIEQRDVRSLFVETSVSPKSMNKIAQDTGLPIHSKLFTDSLAKAGQPGDTYYTMMKWNIEKIHAGLNKT
ncbi:metal ABC transporter solute-binding protein, Zn/Mn family [Lacticaseibacillus jixianensis]|uniref:Metal ABC transporter solute-binding protein, Zn/Mn family n=1 Tax=Lacticaseibacillus jixianensis TaxID=2486012 RepID=A0ABW4B8B9_9LACO|nr:zinc ABC transporter substrate-binding protein [Lacticaseibacillus jixianensis]